MGSLLRETIREPGVESPASYARRVRWLAIIHVGLLAASGVGEALLTLRGRLLVTLTQRSNVETLTLVFFVVFFAYVGYLGARGVPGALRIAWYAAVASTAGRGEAERRKMAGLGAPREMRHTVALNVIVERDGQPHHPFELRIADTHGAIGQLRIDGARVEHLQAYGEGSNNLLAYFSRQASELVRGRGGREIDVVEWKSLDDESAEQYLGQVEFARNLARHLGVPELWPRVVLTDPDCAELERRLAAICPALRDEAFLPHWEYAGEHKLPIVPEPLGLVSLSRSERRTDPLATMGAAMWIVLAAVAVLVAIILFPPWVPGA
jgi:hypothetical protein